MLKHPIRNAQERISKVKQHFEEHKQTYIAGAVCFTSGILLARKSVNVTTNVVVVNSESDRPQTTQNQECPCADS